MSICFSKEDIEILVWSLNDVDRLFFCIYVEDIF